MNPPELLQSAELDAADLLKSHPPIWRHGHKRAIYERIKTEGDPVDARLRYTRWKCRELPERCPLHSCEPDLRAGFYTYAESGPAVWHVNFADPRLFAAYGSQLMAQDEWQVMEHPALASVREWLLDEGHPALTIESGAATPVLIHNAPRQCSIDLGSPASQAQPAGLRRLAASLGMGSAHPRVSLYGNGFAAAPLEAVMAATRVCRPVLTSNIIAIAAPTGAGVYTSSQIRGILANAAGAFAAAVEEMRKLDGSAAEIHTGWWGCGAFGGNKPLMFMLQILAARMAGAGRIVFHYGADEERVHLERGREVLDAISSDDTACPRDLCERLADWGFQWGVSDGN